MKILKKVLFLMFIISTSVIYSNTDWPGFRGPDNNGIITDAEWNPSLNGEYKEKWVTEVGKGYSAPSIVGDRLYIMGYSEGKDYIRCLKVKNGKEIWDFSYKAQTGEYPGPRVSPLIHDGKVYTLSRSGDLYCLDAKKGKEIWSVNVMKEYGARKPQWAIAGSPVIEGDSLLLNVGKAGLALNKNSGALIWFGGKGSSGYSTPVLFDHSSGVRAMAIMGGNDLRVVDISNGNILSSYPWRTSYQVNAADPVVDGDKVFISSAYNKGCALIDISKPEGELIWKSDVIKSQFSSLIYRDGYLYGIDGDTFGAARAKLKCISFETGEVLWEERTGLASLIMVNDKMVILNDRGKLRVSSSTPEGYTELFSADVIKRICWTAPVYSDGKIYVRNVNGTLKSIEVK